MPRIVFTNPEQLFDWVKEFCSSNKYVGYVTSKKELIIEPTKSTRPLRYAYYAGDDIDEIAKKLIEKYQIKVFQIKNYEWDLEKSVGVHVPIE